MKHLFVFIIVVVATTSITGCCSPERRAQKLFDQGKYEEVLQQYPTFPIADEARNKIAERLLKEGKYEEILTNYADAPSVNEATFQIAEKLKADGSIRRQDSIRAISDELAAKGNWNELLKRFPNSPSAQLVKAAKGYFQLELIEPLNSIDKRIALETFIADSTYYDWRSVGKARQMLSVLKAHRSPPSK